MPLGWWRSNSCCIDSQEHPGKHKQHVKSTPPGPNRNKIIKDKVAAKAVRDKEQSDMKRGHDKFVVETMSNVATIVKGKLVLYTNFANNSKGTEYWDFPAQLANWKKLVWQNALGFVN